VTCPCGSPARPGEKKCFACARYHSEANKASYARCKANRICWSCKKPLGPEDGNQHRECLERFYERRKEKQKP